MAAGKGPEIAKVGPDHRFDSDLNASLRIISIYEPQTDGVLTRLDVLLNHKAIPGMPFRHGLVGDQRNVAFNTTAPGTSDMFVPANGILGSYTLKANAEDLSQALRDLADAIDGVLKPEC